MSIEKEVERNSAYCGSGGGNWHGGANGSDEGRRQV